MRYFAINYTSKVCDLDSLMGTSLLIVGEILIRSKEFPNKKEIVDKLKSESTNTTEDVVITNRFEFQNKRDFLSYREDTDCKILADNDEEMVSVGGDRFLALNLRIEDAGFSVRACRALVRSNLFFIGDIIKKGEFEIFKLYGVNYSTMADITHTLNKYDLHFGVDVSDWKRPE